MNNIYLTEEIKKLILNEVNELYKNKHKKYKNKYRYEYYINMMLFLLKDINSWSFLKNVVGYGNYNIKTPKYHYVTIKNKFNEWTKKGVFENAFKKYNNVDNNTNLLYIDSTSIYNFKGNENVVINPENKKNKIEIRQIDDKYKMNFDNGFSTSTEQNIDLNDDKLIKKIRHRKYMRHNGEKNKLADLEEEINF